MTESRAYYNESDAKTAAWLRELVRVGAIASGDVDERSIVDVQPGDLVGYTQCHFFAGVGVWSYALRLAGWPDDRPVWTGSCPCQPFSSAGKGEAFDDPRHLWPAWFRLIRECRPLRVFGEQVESAVLRGWLDVVSADVEAEGYTIGSALLGAHSVGAPHIRQRVYFVADTNGGGAREYARELPGHERQHEVRRADRDRASVDRRAVDIVAESNRDGRGIVSATHNDSGRLPPGNDADRLGTTGGMADSAARRRDSRSVGSSSGEATREGQRQLGTDDGRFVVDAASGGRRVSGDASLEGGGGHADRAGVAGELGLAGVEGLEGHAGDVDDRNQSGRERAHATRPAPAAGTLSGFWSDAEWIACTDGKARPVEPGTFPLAHGAPARVVRLRGYGNAIVAQAAEAFIRAYLDVRGG